MHRVRDRGDLVVGIAGEGEDILIDELIVRHVAVIGFENCKVAFERIYRDQASLLAQIGMLDASTLPVVGAEQAHVVLDPTRPRNELITRVAQPDE